MENLILNKKIDLSWGESIAVRQAFVETISTPIIFDIKSLNDLGYPAHAGDPTLVELTKKIIKRQIGNNYKHVLITNGATGGVTIALRAYKTMGFEECWIDKPPHFRFYPGMIEAAGLHRGEGPLNGFSRVYLVDSLSNPLGKFSQMKKDLYNSPIIWDSVYYGKVYSPGNHPQPAHDVLVGGYGKLTGLNGLRTGWIATNDSLLYERIKELVTVEYCGISVPSTKIILDTVGKFKIVDWEYFESRANFKLDSNREEWSKLEKYFCNQPVSPFGMFFYSLIDKHCKKLLEKSNIIWSPGSHLGTTDDFGRFNLGQSCDLIKKAVKEVLKNDKR